MPKFIADGVSQENLEALVHLVKPRLRQKHLADASTIPKIQKGEVEHQRQIILWARPTEEIFSRKVLSRFMGIFELTKNQGLETSADQIVDLLHSHTWFASVSSNQIYKSNFVEQLSQKIAIEHDISPVNQELMRTAIEEALCNGVVHGNLELKSSPINSIDDFTAFNTKIDERLKASLYGDRHIIVQTWTDNSDIWVSVTDEGIGYEPCIENRTQIKVIPEMPKPKAKRRSGRGIEIIHSLTKEIRIDRQGRRLSMRF